MDIIQSALGAAGKAIFEIAAFVFARTAANISTIVTGFLGTGPDADIVAASYSLVILIAQLALVIVVLKVLQMLWYLTREARFFWQRPKSYSALRAGGKRILVVGDSTAYGMGADKPEDSITGRLGHDFPHTEIINRAVGGSLTKEAIGQLQGAEGMFDLIIVCTGGNDIWHFSRLAPLELDLGQLLDAAIAKSNHQVVLLFYANMGMSPIFPGIIRSILHTRTEQVHEIFNRVANMRSVLFIELYTGKRVNDFASNPFVEEPEKYYSQDRMHPSSEGYRLWYNHLWREMVAHHFTFVEQNPLAAAVSEASGELGK